ncbi:hypothetical protein RvVAT039_pl02740 (plasmid) [Agrobacterium vitis]|uniref:hypothetical protein n=1 Tax=Agrobacterium vitis TaxID=373 RepID=UPI0015DAB4BE|nr:hypothetical protein [Agrobacterium vitis]BCH67441.1 hypothetical protein RvVAT039_pl02740 [Agrobacterium vitis]
MSEGGEPVRSVLKRLTGPPVSVVVPKYYFGGPFYPKDGQPGSDGTMLLYMHRENPLPYRTFDMRGKLARNIQDWMDVLLVDYISLDRVAEASLSITRATRKGERLNTPLDQYGLRKFEIPEELNDGRIDLFFAGDINNKTDVIHCGRVGPYGAVNPQCEQTTMLQGIKLSFTYSRRYLSEWKSMKDNVALLIHCIVQEKDI